MYYEIEKSKYTFQDVLVIAITATAEEDRYNATQDTEEIKIENETFFSRVICNFFIIAANYFDPADSKRWIIENVISDRVSYQDVNHIAEFQKRFDAIISRQREDISLSVPLVHKAEEIFFTYRTYCTGDEFSVEIDRVITRKLGTDTIISKMPEDVFSPSVLKELHGKHIAVNEEFAADSQAFIRYYSLHSEMLASQDKITVYSLSLQSAYYSLLRRISSGTILHKLYLDLIK